ncbi:MAG: DNA-processing protein DprA [Bacteroidetes bacterium]|nr:DNA-processing protein DprA [Bacteroidota bacterium]
MNEDERLKYQIALTLLPGVGPVLAKNLVSYCGSVENIFKKKKANLERIPGIGVERAAAIANHAVFDQAEKEVAFIRKHKITSLFYTDQEYPIRLKNCEDAPPLLFFKGKCDMNAERMVAIVGTRHSTAYGKEITEQLVGDLGKYNAVIVSGLAYGIDIVAHKACVKNNVPTIGVLAHGLDRIYPAEHKPTAEKMVRNGGVLTEFISKTNPDRENFPSRNRIVAGMVDAVIVVESALKGGALITADIANGYNREVFAVPGRANSTYSQGCNEYIRLNKAALAENAEHIASLMNWNTPEKSKPPKQLNIFRELNPEEKVLIDLLKEKGKIDIDTLMIQSGLPVHKVSSTLLNLEFDGMLKALPGKMFELL